MKINVEAIRKSIKRQQERAHKERLDSVFQNLREVAGNGEYAMSVGLGLEDVFTGLGYEVRSTSDPRFMVVSWASGQAIGSLPIRAGTARRRADFTNSLQIEEFSDGIIATLRSGNDYCVYPEGALWTVIREGGMANYLKGLGLHVERQPDCIRLSLK